MPRGKSLSAGVGGEVAVSKKEILIHHGRLTTRFLIIVFIIDMKTAHRSTRQRRLIYEAVAATDTHPTAEWVYAVVRRAMPRVSLETVYRNLSRLVAEGRLKAWARGGSTRY